MVAPPEGIVLERHRDAPLSHSFAWARRAAIVVLLVLVGAALLGVVGQPPRDDAVAAPGATLAVSAPTALRGGLFFQGRITVVARERLDHATLVLAEGWTEQVSINTIEPAPQSESSRSGRLALDYGSLDPGDRLVVYLQLQVNPTNVGRRSQDVVLADGDRVVAAIDRRVTVFP